jgi:hypothetical protein
MRSLRIYIGHLYFLSYLGLKGYSCLVDAFFSLALLDEIYRVRVRVKVVVGIGLGIFGVSLGLGQDGLR